MNTLTTRPSRIRWLILALLFLISVVTYIDRVNISVTARQMMPAYGMTDQEMGQEKREQPELARWLITREGLIYSPLLMC